MSITDLDRIDRRPEPSTIVTVHPLVLLSVVDHYNRAFKDTSNRAVGVLLGSWKGSRLDVANSFAGTDCLLSLLILLRCNGQRCRETQCDTVESHEGKAFASEYKQPAGSHSCQTSPTAPSIATRLTSTLLLFNSAL